MNTQTQHTPGLDRLPVCVILGSERSRLCQPTPASDVAGLERFKEGGGVCAVLLDGQRCGENGTRTKRVSRDGGGRRGSGVTGEMNTIDAADSSAAAQECARHTQGVGCGWLPETSRRNNCNCSTEKQAGRARIVAVV